MQNFIHWYNTNKEKIWVGIFFVVFLLLIIYTVNNSYSENDKSEDKIINSRVNNINDKLNSITLESDKSSIMGATITTGQSNLLDTLNSFASYCNDGEMDKAYALLSDDCKSEMYTTKDSFVQNYYNRVFQNSKKEITVENWFGRTYKVKFSEDALSTGKYNENSTIQDYITIVTDENKNCRLNINGYIGKQKINKVKEENGIKVRVIESDTYMDYQTYKIEFTNNSPQTIMIDDLDNPDTMYLEDENLLKYYAYTHELTNELLKLNSNEKKTITIKYYGKYSSEKTIKNLVFSRVILNYGAYSNYQNIGYYKDYESISVAL